MRFEAKTIEALEHEQRYDVVFCLNVINHVRDIERAYVALTRALKRGGILVLSVDAHKHALIRRLFRLVPMDILHPHQYFLREYQEALQRRGMGIERSVRIKTGNLFDYYAIVCTKE